MIIGPSRHSLFWITVLALINFLALMPQKGFSESVDMARSQSGGAKSLSLFAGSGAGMSRLRGDAIDGAVHGRQFSVFGLLSPRWSRAYGDLGMGWQHHRTVGKLDNGTKFDIITRSAALDLNPGVLLTPRWQLGPLLSVLFGTDTRFGIDQEGKNQTVMWGGRVNYEWQTQGGLPLRLFGQSLWETTIRERSVVTATVGMMVGIPMQLRNEVLAEAPAPAPEKQTVVRISLDPEVIFFRTASAGISPEIRNLLNSVGQQLESAKGEWESMEIVGHADQRGSRSNNDTLSRKRAEKISDALTAAGLQQARIRLQYFGEDRLKNPDNNSKAWAQNRRVEVVFRGVQDVPHLMSILKPLQDLTPDEKR